jgi:glycosyltransferase involved in cell wall biosynthesis
VLQHYWPVIGGTENQAKLLNEELVRHGHEVVVVTSCIPGTARRETINGVEVLRFPFPPLFWRPYGPSAIRFFARSLRIVLVLWRRRRHLDLIHVHMFREPALIAAFLNRFLRKPLLVKVACSGRAGDVAYLTRVQLRPFFRRLAAQVPFAVAVNQESAEEVRRHFPATRVLAVFPNGVQLPQLQPPPAAGVPAPVRLLYCGRLAPEKDVGTILRALALLVAEVPDLELRIAGDGPDRPTIERVTADLGLAGRVALLGRVDSRALYLQADIYVTASQSEGMPNALLEAMATGVVPVCSDIAGHREVVQPNVTGLLFEPGNAAALAAQLRRLCADADLRRGLAQNARQEMERGYGIAQVAGRYVALYADLVRPRRDPVRAIRRAEITTALAALRGAAVRRALEIGAGDGFHAEALEGIASVLVLSDADEGRLARYRHPRRVVCRAEQLPFRAAGFDLVTSSMVWEHLQGRTLANAETARILAEKGRVLHLVPTRTWKTLQFCLHWTELPGRLRTRRRQRSEARQARGNSSGELGTSNAPPGPESPCLDEHARPGLRHRLAAWLVPPIHGTYGTHREEWRAYGRRAWRESFRGQFELEASGPLLFYSPYLWTGGRLLVVRRLLGSLGLAAAQYLLLRRAVRPAPSEVARG